MKILKNSSFIIAFTAAILFTLLGAWLKLNHFDGAALFLIIGVISTFIYIAIGISEVTQSKKLKTTEKLIWSVGFIAFSFLVGVFYVLMGRKHIVSN